jgi:class 3 adenylate cyclase
VVCQQLGFEVGELWRPISRSEIDATKYPALLAYPRSPLYLQRLHQVSHNVTDTDQSFIAVSDRVLLLPGTGLAGRIWEHRTPQWIYELHNDRDFGERSFACQDGLRSGLGFPIMADGEVLGVMTFFSLEQQQHNPELLHIMDAIGQQLGQYIRRKQTENALKEQQQQTESLLLNILPETIAIQLRQSGRTLARQFDAVTVLFADIVGFTEFASELSPIEVVEVLNDLFSSFDTLTEKYKLEKIKTIGDAYMVVGGLPEPRPDHAQAIAEMALGMKEAVKQYNKHTNSTLQLRIGIHSGAVVAGVIGQKKFIYDLWGDTVNIASRMESHGVPEEIQCSRVTYELLKEFDYTWQPRGSIPVKGKGEMTTYLLTGKAS